MYLIIYIKTNVFRIYMSKKILIVSFMFFFNLVIILLTQIKLLFYYNTVLYFILQVKINFKPNTSCERAFKLKIQNTEIVDQKLFDNISCYHSCQYFKNTPLYLRTLNFKNFLFLTYRVMLEPTMSIIRLTIDNYGSYFLHINFFTNNTRYN